MVAVLLQTVDGIPIVSEGRHVSVLRVLVLAIRLLRLHGAS